MDAKTPKARKAKPASDDAAVDAYVARNKDALNASIKKADIEFERGEYFTLDQVNADIAAQRHRRIRKA